MHILEAIIFGLPSICKRCGQEVEKLDMRTGLCWPCVYERKKERKEGGE